MDNKLTQALNDSKTIEFPHTTLRSALDIYKKGGHVTKVFRDQKYRLIHDGRREMIVPPEYELSIFNDTMN